MSRPLPRFYRNQTEAEDAAMITRILIDTGAAAPNLDTVQRATLAGDERRLRGIPVCARGVSGTSPGTNPLAEACRCDHSE